MMDIENVSFSYWKDKKLISDLSLFIPKNKVLDCKVIMSR